MSARQTEDDGFGGAFSIEAHGRGPRRPSGRLARLFPKPVIIAAGIGFPLAVIALLSYLLCMVLTSAVPLALPVAVGLGNIVGNVPEPDDFDRLLTRDLETYFVHQTGKTVTVTYELLRDMPSQAGMAYPKYYAWVRVFDGATKVQSGVVRVEAMEKTTAEAP
jgi:hypothetical protein